MEKHKQLRERFGNVLPTDNAVEVLEAIEQWLIERENQALRIHDVSGRSEQFVCDFCKDMGRKYVGVPLGYIKYSKCGKY